MKAILKLESLLLVVVALLISSCASGPDVPSASDSTVPSPPTAPAASGNGETQSLVGSGDDLSQ